MTEHSVGIGTVNRKMVRERAVELAIINGRSAQEVSKSDWEQAKRELTGERDTDSKELVLESAPEPQRVTTATLLLLETGEAFLAVTTL